MKFTVGDRVILKNPKNTTLSFLGKSLEVKVSTMKNVLEYYPFEIIAINKQKYLITSAEPLKHPSAIKFEVSASEIKYDSTLLEDLGFNKKSEAYKELMK